MILQTQEEADLYWSTRETKKWVVVMKARPRTVYYGPVVDYRQASKRITPTREVFISAKTRERARQAALLADFSNEKFTVVEVRLARAHDLGCVWVETRAAA